MGIGLLQPACAYSTHSPADLDPAGSVLPLSGGLNLPQGPCWMGSVYDIVSQSVSLSFFSYLLLHTVHQAVLRR